MKPILTSFDEVDRAASRLFENANATATRDPFTLPDGGRR
jgi:hypothetical protein